MEYENEIEYHVILTCTLWIKMDCRFLVCFVVFLSRGIFNIQYRLADGDNAMRSPIFSSDVLSITNAMQSNPIHCIHCIMIWFPVGIFPSLCLILLRFLLHSKLYPCVCTACDHLCCHGWKINEIPLLIRRISKLHSIILNGITSAIHLSKCIINTIALIRHYVHG